DSGPLATREHEVHVWCCDLDGSELSCARLHHVLSEVERARAARFRFARDRYRFIAGHAFARHILARYCGQAPADLAFEYGPAGKPYLADWTSIHFNYSGTTHRGVLAVGKCQIGVDIEQVDWNIDCAAIADQFFCASERNDI